MILQNILFPSVDTCTEERMYFRRYGETDDIEYSWCGDHIRVDKDASLSFDTYFNSISAEKWCKYTKVRKVRLNVRITGGFRLTIVRSDVVNRQTEQEFTLERLIKSKGREPEEFSFEFDITDKKGIYSFNLHSVSNNSRFYGGNYSADIAPEQVDRVKIAIDICTYKRETFVEANLLKLRKYFLENEASVLYDKLEVFVSDNAHTLDIPSLQSDRIHIVRNKNVGGAGGFTRGMIEIGDVREEKGITHILVMDDDIRIEPEAILRTYTMLALLSDGFKDAFIGGSMLRLDLPFKQVEAGAAWNCGDIISFKRDLDLRETENVILNEIEESSQYNAWWFCAFPASVVREDNLPLPIFIRGDDIEYGLRNMRHLILMNGICVWHEPFENKYSSFLFYYIMRNRLIDNAVHHMVINKKILKRILERQIMDEVRLYRYKNAELIMRGVEDYLRGLNWLMDQDGEALHKSVMNDGYKLQYVEEIQGGIPFVMQSFRISCDQPAAVGLMARIKNHFTINGHYLSAKYGVNIVSTVGVQQSSVYRRAGVLNYDYASRKGFMTWRDKNKMKECRERFKRLCKQIDRDYDRVTAEFGANSRRMMTRSFWNKYLEL